ncbi:MAG: phosphoribosylanthranilate isomerase [Dehalococcoidia bacterium]
MIKVKICGVTQSAHALAAASAGADFIGIVFAESPRRLTIEQAMPVVEAVRRLGDARPRVVGVFANASPHEVNATAEALDLDLVQLSGDEPRDVVGQVRRPVIKAVHLPAGQPAKAVLPAVREAMSRWRDAKALPLLDARSAGRYGGTGTAIDWEIAMELAEEYDFLLAGGLRPESVGEAVKRIRPWGVDVSSGVETAGVKDPEKVRAFVEAARQA